LLFWESEKSISIISKKIDLIRKFSQKDNKLNRTEKLWCTALFALTRPDKKLCPGNFSPTDGLN
jgi:hypothetical protein